MQLTTLGDGNIEIGYGVPENQRGHGHGTFAIKQALIQGKMIDTDSRVFGYVLEENVASQRCFEKNGFIRRNIYVERFFPLLGGNRRMWLYEHGEINEKDCINK